MVHGIKHLLSALSGVFRDMERLVEEFVGERLVFERSGIDLHVEISTLDGGAGGKSAHAHVAD